MIIKHTMDYICYKSIKLSYEVYQINYLKIYENHNKQGEKVSLNVKAQ